MTSHLLLEGVLDVKDPRGSEDRKFWKAWRRVWTSFSVIYPSGRREPYLLLSLYHGSSEVPEKEIKLSRDGLRLFRCRSKSRPYRTWAMASGNKVVLYFAAETEVQGQNWMQSVRDGLWPPCFSFQMLSDACSHEVSLIDDDNTFLSGVLGVYGRFVRTSEDTISLMHPHWGATLLEISLGNIKDVLFVREAEVSPAGVFSIVLKRVEGSKVKALQFFCNAAKEVIQWILSKLYEKNLKEDKEALEIKISISNCDLPIKNELELSSENKHTLGASYAIPSISTQERVQVDGNSDNTIPQYENLQQLKIITQLNASGPSKNNTKNAVQYGKVNKRNSLEDASEQIFLRLRKMETENEYSIVARNIQGKSPNLTPNDHIYANAIDSATENLLGSSNSDSDNIQNEYENVKLLSEKAASPTLPPKNTSDDVTYAIVNKNNISKNSNSIILETKFSTNQLSTSEKVIENEYMSMSTVNMTDTSGDNEFCRKSSKTIIEKIETSSNDCFDLPLDNKFEHGSMEIREVGSNPKSLRAEFHPNPQLYSIMVNKSTRPSNEHIQNAQLSIKDSLNDYRNTQMENSRLLPNLPSEFLDTSLNFAKLEDKLLRRSSSTEAEEFGDFSERFYEDIIDRKGTVYEEIDSSDDESPVPLPPELPQRPENLEIPDSLRLQKLSKSIKQTLKIMENTDSSKREFPRTKFIKKIKDANRVMQISPSKEHAREPFAVETKLPVTSGTMLDITSSLKVNPSSNIS